MTPPVPGAVFDCVVLLQAAISKKGPSFACKELFDAGKLTLFLSAEILAEVTDVLNRPKLRMKFKTLTPERAETFLRDLTGKAISLPDVPKIISLPRDPEDSATLTSPLLRGPVTW